MPDWRADRERRELVWRVVEFVAMSPPLDPATVLRHFAAHPWFRPGDHEHVILGTTGAAAILLDGTVGDAVSDPLTWAVSSVSQFGGMLLASTSHASVPNAPPTLPIIGMPQHLGASDPAKSAFLPTSALEEDQGVLRARLKKLRRYSSKDARQVAEWVEHEHTAYPDLVRAYYDWRTGCARLWLGGVQGGGLFAIHLLSRRTALRAKLRICGTCDAPWFPRRRGRPPSRRCPRCRSA